MKQNDKSDSDRDRFQEYLLASKVSLHLKKHFPPALFYGKLLGLYRELSEANAKS